MLRKCLLLAAASAAVAAISMPDARSILHVERASAGDLEVGGELAGVPPGLTRFIRYEDLLSLPQETYTVNDDSNLAKGTQISGVRLETLAALVAKNPGSALIVAICYDRYRTNYPRDYQAEHHPLLVLRINGQTREHWPPAAEGGSLAPYFISHAFFKPAFKVLSHEDEAQIPYGVNRIEFRSEALVFGAIRPPGDWPAHSPVAQGYIVARQDCFRCHNMGAEGGTMGGRSWRELGMIARDNGARFRAIIRNPVAVSPGAKMPGQPGYDDATLDALTAYFETFADPHPQTTKEPKP